MELPNCSNGTLISVSFYFIYISIFMFVSCPDIMVQLPVRDQTVFRVRFVLTNEKHEPLPFSSSGGRGRETLDSFYFLDWGSGEKGETLRVPVFPLFLGCDENIGVKDMVIFRFHFQ